MTTEELDRALRQRRLGGLADTLAVRAQQARADNLGPLDFLSLLVHDELDRRRDRLIERRVEAAAFRDRKTLDTLTGSSTPRSIARSSTKWPPQGSSNSGVTASSWEIPEAASRISPKPSA